jgi:PIN domain nuclease of toxin-antitoxin system
MRYLIDTHVFLWFLEGDQRLHKRVRSLIATSENEIWLSIASLWEIAIKTNLGKLTLSKPFAELIPQQLAENDIVVLPISLDDLNVVVNLPLHHRDPFDRLLIAQAISRSIPLISDDGNFSVYPITLVW